jgi:predicted transcriptional regulator
LSRIRLHDGIVVTRTVILCHPGDLLHDVCSIMKARGLKNLPVVGQDSRPAGVLSPRDALEVTLEEVEYEGGCYADM